jgi:predicted permease
MCGLDAKLKVLWFFVDLALPLACGYLLHYVGWMSRKQGDVVIKVNLRVVATAVSLVSFWGAALTLQLIWLPVLGVMMQIIPGVVSGALARRKYDGPLEQGGFVLATMLSNRGVVGTLSVFILYGEQGYVWSRLVMLLAPLVQYMVCFPLAQYYSDRHRGEDNGRPSLWSVLFSWNQVPVVGIAIGFALNHLDVARPQMVGDALPWAVHLLAWGVVLPLGASLNFAQLRRFMPDMIELLALKFLVTPLLVGLLGYAIGLRGDVLAAVTILAASPSAIMAVVAGRLYKLNVDLAMAAFVLSTVVYIVMVFPVILWLLS